jgi:hypothetical protein
VGLQSTRARDIPLFLFPPILFSRSLPRPVPSVGPTALFGGVV